MSVLAGATAPDAASMTLNGVPYAPRDPREARNAGVAMIYQELSLAPHMSVMDNIALGLEPARQGVLGSLGILQRDAMRSTARAALAQLGHSDIAVDAPVGELSPAARSSSIARTRVQVPRAGAGRADEQPGTWRVGSFSELIGRLKQQGSPSFTSRTSSKVTEVSDRFVVLRDGRNAGEGVTSGPVAIES
jgi:ribose transport system ATP-binding protein